MNKNEDFILESEINQDKYDPHRLIFHMSLGGVIICIIGIISTVIALAQKIGWQILYIHIDTLGDYLISPLAYVYNISLLLAGVCFMLAMFGLYMLRYNHFGLTLSISGSATGFCISLLGVYPYNDALTHYICVVLFVCSTLVMFSLMIFCRKKYPQLCPTPLWIVSFFGIIISGLYLLELSPNNIIYHICPIPEFCYIGGLAGLHTLVTLCGGVGLAMLAQNLPQSTY